MKTPHRSRPDRASALLATMAALVFIAILTGAALHFTAEMARISERGGRFERARSEAESALEIAFVDWKARIRAGDASRPLAAGELGNLAVPGTGEIQGLDTSRAAVAADADLALDPARKGVHRLNGLHLSPLTNPAATERQPPKDRAQGISAAAAVFRYLATAEVSRPGPGTHATALVQAIFEQQVESLWDYALFVDGNLTLATGARIEGWMHANGDLELSAGAGDLPGRVTTSGSLGSVPDGPTPPVLSAPQKVLLGKADWVDRSDANPNNDGLRELVERAEAGHPDPIDGTRLASLAGVRLLWSDSGVSVESAGPPGKGGKPLADGSGILACVSEGGLLPDAGGNGQIPTTTIDIAALRAIVDNNAVAGWNGVLHIADQRSGPRAFRLRNGGILPAGGLLVASPNTLYIEGNFNTSGVRGNSEPAPAAVAADGIVLLSPAWNDGGAGYGAPATSMTVHAGLISGTPAEARSVSPLDLLRRVEDWEAAQLTIRGALLGLFASDGTAATAASDRWTVPQAFTLSHAPALLTPPAASPLVAVSLWKRPAPGADPGDLGSAPVADGTPGKGGGKEKPN